MITVIKIGGSILEPEPAAGFIAALARARSANNRVGGQLVFVHGGGKTLTELLARLGTKASFVNGLRVTDRDTLDAAMMAFAGKVNTKLVDALGRPGGFRAVGLTGLDGESVLARRGQGDRDLGYVGYDPVCDPSLPALLLGQGYTPVFASLAAEHNGGVLNVNADLFAAAVARSLGAARLLFMTDVAGIRDHSGNYLATVTLQELAGLSSAGALSGGMLPKSDACAAALRGGVAEVAIIGPEAAARLDEVLTGSLTAGTRVLLD